jgi:hypothetical protein
VEADKALGVVGSGKAEAEEGDGFCVEDVSPLVHWESPWAVGEVEDTLVVLQKESALVVWLDDSLRKLRNEAEIDLRK